MNVTIHFQAASKQFEATGEVAPTEGQNTIAVFEVPPAHTDLAPAALCEVLFAATNTYGQVYPEVWASIEPALSDSRTHTSLSVGDVVSIEGLGSWECASVGWTRVG